jgi:hypothetical protein
MSISPYQAFVWAPWAQTIGIQSPSVQQMDTYDKTKQTWTSPPSQELWVVNAWSFIVFVDVFKWQVQQKIDLHDSIRCWVSNVIVLDTILDVPAYVD